MKQEIYLGDGAYARYDGFETVLYTNDGIHTLNEVCLEPDAVQLFVKWIEAVRQMAEIENE